MSPISVTVRSFCTVCWKAVEKEIGFVHVWEHQSVFNIQAWAQLFLLLFHKENVVGKEHLVINRCTISVASQPTGSFSRFALWHALPGGVFVQTHMGIKWTLQKFPRENTHQSHQNDCVTKWLQEARGARRRQPFQYCHRQKFVLPTLPLSATPTSISKLLPHQERGLETRAGKTSRSSPPFLCQAWISLTPWTLSTFSSTWNVSSLNFSFFPLSHYF